MVKDSTFCLALLMVSLNPWLFLGASSMFAFAAPTSEDTQAILSSLSESAGDRVAKEIFLPGKAIEEAELVRSLEEFLPRIADSEGDALYCRSGEMDKRRLRSGRRRQSKGFLHEDKRRLRFIKRQEASEEEDDGTLAPRLRFQTTR